MTANATTDTAYSASPRTFLGHPVGLGYLAFTEAWERFSFYGMQTLLVLYMIDQALRPGHIEHILGFGVLRGAIQGLTGPLSTQALSSQVFGIYTAAVYVTPLLGGFVGDRWLGRTGAIVLGASLMAAGQFLMAFEVSFVIALALLIFGAGFIKGNIAAQVGGLYPRDHARRDEAFQVFVLAINAGVIAAPLVCGTLGELWGWSYGFAAAGVGMLIALCIYLAGRKHLPPDLPRQRKTSETARLSRREWRTIVALVAILPILAVGFVGNNQIYNAYVVWAKETADLNVFGWRMPVTWLLSYDAGVSAAFMALAVLVWRWFATRGFAPHELTKLAIGFSISILGFLLLAFAAVASGQGKVALYWLLAFHVINTIGYVNVLPFGLALFSRAAPPAVNATMISVFYLALFGTNVMVGWVGSLYGTMSHADFWLLHGALCGASAAAILVLYRPLRGALTPEEATGSAVATHD